jgi:hypothetical protein
MQITSEAERWMAGREYAVVSTHVTAAGGRVRLLGLRP